LPKRKRFTGRRFQIHFLKYYSSGFFGKGNKPGYFGANIFGLEIKKPAILSDSRELESAFPDGIGCKIIPATDYLHK